MRSDPLLKSTNIHKKLKVCVLLFSAFFSLAAAPDSPPIDGKQAYILSEKQRQELMLESGPEKKTLVQLFTSDVEPTCNPALVWMSSIKENEGALWKKYIPIALHVRQWDNENARDSFGKPEFDAFLKNYARRWGSSRTFAPTVVANGIEWSGWNRGQDVPMAAEKSGILKTDGSQKEGVFLASFTPDPSVNSNEGFQIHGALVSFGIKSRPAHGKNKQNLLTHDFLPIIYQKTSMSSKKMEWVASLALEKPKGIRYQKLAVIFWVTTPSDPTPIQCAGGYLPV